MIHTVVLDGLKADTQYSYRVRSIGGYWSQVFEFKTFPAESHARSAQLLITADVGTTSIPKAAIAEAVAGKYAMHLHAGDMAYDMSLNHGTRGDGFFRELQPIASRIPFQAVPGNHECDGESETFMHRTNGLNSSLQITFATSSAFVPDSRTRT